MLDLGFLDHSVDSADRAANLSSDSRDGEAGCSESGDPACRIALERMIVQAQDLELRASLGICSQSRRHRVASGAFVILLHSSRPYIDG